MSAAHPSCATRRVQWSPARTRGASKAITTLTGCSMSEHSGSRASIAADSASVSGYLRCTDLINPMHTHRHTHTHTHTIYTHTHTHTHSHAYMHSFSSSNTHAYSHSRTEMNKISYLRQGRRPCCRGSLRASATAATQCAERATQCEKEKGM
jgi:hypothetical protein